MIPLFIIAGLSAVCLAVWAMASDVLNDALDWLQRVHRRWFVRMRFSAVVLGIAFLGPCGMISDLPCWMTGAPFC